MKSFKEFLKEDSDKFVQNPSQDVPIYKKEIGKFQDITLYLVKGEEVRNKIAVDFTMGGHGYVYEFVPKDEVWIDDRMSPFDIGCTIIHELIERLIMMRDGLEYSEAHEIATNFEYKLRDDHLKENK